MNDDISPASGAVAGKPAGVRVAVFDRRRLAAEGFAALLARKGEVDVVEVTTSVHQAADLLGSTSVDVVVIGIAPADSATAMRMLRAIPTKQRNLGPRVVGVVSGDQALADRISTTSVTALSTQVDSAALFEFVAAGQPHGIVEMPSALVRPQVEREERSVSSHPSLTARERQVLIGMERGLSTKEIAAGLSISPNTVRTHVQRLMSKMAVHSRVQAVAVAAAEDGSS